MEKIVSTKRSALKSNVASLSAPVSTEIAEKFAKKMQTKPTPKRAKSSKRSIVEIAAPAPVPTDAAILSERAKRAAATRRDNAAKRAAAAIRAAEAARLSAIAQKAVATRRANAANGIAPRSATPKLSPSLAAVAANRTRTIAKMQRETDKTKRAEYAAKIADYDARLNGSAPAAAPKTSTVKNSRDAKIEKLLKQLRELL